MRVLIISGIFPPDIGGPATYVPKLAAYLAGGGNQVTVITLSDRLGLTEPSQHPFSVVRIQRGLWIPLRAMITIATIIRHALFADRVYVNGLYTQSAIGLGVLAKPFIVKIVGDPGWERAVGRGYFNGDIENFQKLRLSLAALSCAALRSWAIGRAAKVIVPSRYLAKIVSGWGIPENRIRVILNGVSLPKSQTHSVSLTHGHTPTLITVARLVPWKGVAQLIEVISDLPDYRLIIIGDGPERGALELLIAKLHLEHRVELRGKLDPDQLHAVMKKADLFVLNSDYEGLPHIVLEATALGVPVLVKDRGGSAEAVIPEHTGILFSALTPQLMSSTLELISTSGFRARLEQSAEELLARFTEREMLDRTLAELN